MPSRCAEWSGCWSARDDARLTGAKSRIQPRGQEHPQGFSAGRSRMSLRQRRAAEQFPKAGWPVSDDHLVVMHAGNVVGTLRRMDGDPQHGHWLWSITGCYVPPGVMVTFRPFGSHRPPMHSRRRIETATEPRRQSGPPDMAHAARTQATASRALFPKRTEEARHKQVALGPRHAMAGAFCSASRSMRAPCARSLARTVSGTI
jgi:hypothetical protein